MLQAREGLVALILAMCDDGDGDFNGDWQQR